MRQLTPATNLILSVLTAAGLLVALGLPWYAPPVPDTNEFDGPVERTAWAFAHVFEHNAGAVSGSASIGTARVLLIALVAAVVLLSAIASVDSLRRHVREVLRGTALIAPAVVLYLSIDRPGHGMDLHWGALVAVVVSTFMASSAWHGSEVRVKHAPARAWTRHAA